MPFSNAIPLPGGRVGYDVRDVIAALNRLTLFASIGLSLMAARKSWK